MAAQQTELVDFYVAPFEGTVGVVRTWLVRRGSPTSTFVAVCSSRDEALQRATAMSRSQRRIGKTSVVYVQEKPGGAWRILAD